MYYTILYIHLPIIEKSHGKSAFIIENVTQRFFKLVYILFKIFNHIFSLKKTVNSLMKLPHMCIN